MDSSTSCYKFATLAVHAGSDPDQWICKSMWPPIITATTYKQDEPDKFLEYAYIREGNPTRDCLQEAIAAIDGANYAFVANSGSTASSLILQAILRTGDHIVVSQEVYYGSTVIINQIAKYGITCTQANFFNTESIQAAINTNTKVFWVDCPSNPLLKVVNLKAISSLAHDNGCLLVVDSTFATSYFLQPLSLGVDVVMQSGTKYLNGHGDVLLGAVTTSNPQIATRMTELQMTVGALPSPFDCYLANRGLRTLHVRMKQHALNALAVAQYLDKSPLVETTIYPGLPSHPQHEIAKRQFTNNGYGGMVSFKIKGGLENAKKFLSNLKVFQMAVSLGDIESLAEICTIMTRKGMTKEGKKQIGITDNLIRLSIGLEDVDDLISDLEQALETSSCV